MTKTILVVAALFAATASPSFAQTVEPPAHQTGLIDTLLRNADTLRCAVVRDDLPNEALLSGCANIQRGTNSD
jgi:hypothetical protein